MHATFLFGCGMDMGGGSIRRGDPLPAPHAPPAAIRPVNQRHAGPVRDRGF
ncbi:hypothetical protein [Novacetimonas hansenii]|uniref:hypothetical protein n=1 Tax=Novacetimonas hansenii TaxID=436 RepID=UPI00131F1D6A|nr:hypothetical protein [Novacetimonas hansenii]